MLEYSEEARVFETMKDDLLRTAPGRFAVVCRRRLIGVFDSIDQALLATSHIFDAGGLSEGAPILISEIAEKVQVRVMATPSGKSALAPA